jgi:hypothetical protein
VASPVADHHHVNPDAAAVLRALLNAKDGATTRAIAVAAGIAPEAADDLLAALAVVGLVEPTAPGRWRPHPTIREHNDHQAVDGLLTLLAGQPLALPPEPKAPPPPRPRQPGPLPLKAAAEELGVSWYTLRNWARLGRVPYTWTPGGRRRFNVEEIRPLQPTRPHHLPARSRQLDRPSGTHPG